MNKIISLVILVVLVSCSGTNTLIKQNRYDEAIDLLTKQVTKQTFSIKTIEKIDQIMNEAVKKDLSTIEHLKLSGEPDVWYEIFGIYQKIEARQQKISTLPDTAINLMQYKIEDYSDYTNQARIKATQYHWAKAERHLENNDPKEIEKAYHHLLKVQELAPGYKTSNELLSNFKKARPVEIFYRVNNRFKGYLPPAVIDEITYLDLSSLSTTTYKFRNKKAKKQPFDYIISIDIYDVKIIPENTNDSYYVETAQVQDGIAYKLDDNANFVYDSLGRKIEYPKLKNIACYVTETVKKKAIFIGGNVIISEAATGKTIGEQAISGESRFLSRSAKFKGDINALAPETRELLGSKEAEYPSDLELIMRASDKFKINAANYIIHEIKQKSPITTEADHSF
ncbi:MAG TPA: hypothetical protein PK692_08710 [Bacteroidales bacterium]|nr:hypothetical protein [Bacteroidales bacterium]HQO08124.1 hypothetical protein [Bacteroidales bacterium]HQP52733.1 hypothetical protein [Bacteroidales bacterium]